MKVLLTGATGFTGSYVLRLLLAQGIRPRCLVRRETDPAPLKAQDIEVAIGDVADESSLESAMRGVDVLLNIVSLGFGHAPNIVSAAERAAIERAVFVSTTAIFTSLNAKSKIVRTAAEERIEESSLRYTIIRPTMIYGSPRDRNMARLIRFLRRSPLIPVIGSGTNLQQPVYVGDVAAAVVVAMQKEAAIRRAYNVAGAAPLTFIEVIDTIARLLRRRIRRIHFPVAPMLAALLAFERLGLKLPVKSEQILRLNEDKAFDYSDAVRDFGYAPLTFEEGIRSELLEMGLTADAAG